MTDMEVDDLQATGAKEKDKGKKDGKKRFEVKKVYSLPIYLLPSLSPLTFLCPSGMPYRYGRGVSEPVRTHSHKSSINPFA
jgi:hypothetical protein